MSAPGLLARIVTTLAVLSQRRAMLGLGAAWYEREPDAADPVGWTEQMCDKVLPRLETIGA